MYLCRRKHKRNSLGRCYKVISKNTKTKVNRFSIEFIDLKCSNHFYLVNKIMHKAVKKLIKTREF